MARHIRDHFQDKKQDIDLLRAEDPEFLTLCEDHDACVDALRYWVRSQEPEAKTRADEYRVLVRELKEEISQSLSARQRRALD